VPGEGNTDAAIVFIGEAPGKEEAKTGKPFVGRSGKLLRSCIRAIGLGEEEVFITSPVKYLPDRGTPSVSAVAHGRTHLEKQLAVIRPRIIVLLGAIACSAVLGRKLPIAEIHGTTREKDGRTCLITFHPAAAVRFPRVREAFLKDFEALKKLITEKRSG
jgi:DNA polymerase